MMRLGAAVSFVFVCACSSGGSSGGGTGGTGGTAQGGTGNLGGSGGTAATGGTAGSATGGVGNTGGSAGAGTGGATGKPKIEIDTNMGKMVVELEEELLPITTANFLVYVDEGFFDGTIIHRVIPDFVIQGGGFTPGLSQKSTHPPIQLETHPSVLHDYGAISMARTDVLDSATSQFFLVNAAAGSHGLDGDYAAFGKMTEGNTTLDAISAAPTSTQSGLQDVPVTDVVVNSIKRL
jgi:peptidyl-prolyl cis-trans isomerase A (cyclophilin A)